MIPGLLWAAQAVAVNAMMSYVPKTHIMWDRRSRAWLVITDMKVAEGRRSQVTRVSRGIDGFPGYRLMIAQRDNEDALLGHGRSALWRR